MAQQASSPPVSWQRRMGGSSNEAWEGICAASDGGMVVCGYTSSVDGDAGEGKGNTDAWVVRFSAYGDVLWKRRYGGSNIDFANSVVPGEGGGFVVAGVSYSDDGDVSGNHGYSDGWLLKLTDNGDVEWSYLYGGAYFEEAVAVQRAKSGGYVVAGGTCSQDGPLNHESRGLYDGWVFQVDRFGVLLWQHSLGGSMNDYFYHLDQMHDEGWILAGETFSQDGDIRLNHGKSDAWLAAVSKDGIYKWSYTYGEGGYDRFFSVHQLTGGDLIASGYYQKGEDYDAVVNKIDVEGNLKKQIFFGGNMPDFLLSAELKDDGGVIFSGSTESKKDGFADSGSKGDGWAFEIDSNWRVRWEYVAGGDESDAFVGVYPAAFNRVYLVGYSYSSDNISIPFFGMQDTWFVALNTDLVSATSENKPEYVYNVYPNPANSSGGVYIQNEEHTMISSVQLLSVSGAILKSFRNLRDGETLNLQGILPGIYWLKIQRGTDKPYTTKLIVQ